MLLSPQMVLLLAALTGVVSVVLGARAKRATRARKLLAEAWPAFIDSVGSSLGSGVNRIEAIELAIERAPKILQSKLSEFDAVLSKARFQDALIFLKGNLELACVDEFVELMITNEKLGGAGLVSLLRDHGKRVRSINAASSLAQAKTSATLGVAKLGVTAPWILLVLLLTRSESAETFNSPQGIGVLLFGLACCIGAFRLIQVIAKAPNEVRVYG